jgi:hypothetical protein
VVPYDGKGYGDLKEGPGHRTAVQDLGAVSPRPARGQIMPPLSVVGVICQEHAPGRRQSDNHSLMVLCW